MVGFSSEGTNDFLIEGTNFKSKYQKEKLKNKLLQQRIEKFRISMSWIDDIVAKGKRI